MDIPTFDDLLGPIKTKLWVAGIAYGQRKICIRFYIIFTCLMIVTFQELVYLILYSSFDNFLKITQVLPCLCTCITTTIKIAALLAKHKEVNDLTNNLQYMYKNILNDNTMRNIVGNEILFLKKLIKVLIIVNVLLIIVYNSSSLFIMLHTYAAKKEVVFDLPFPVAVPVAIDQWLPWLVEYLISVIASGAFEISAIFLQQVQFFILKYSYYDSRLYWTSQISELSKNLFASFQLFNRLTFFCMLFFLSFDSAYFFLSTHVYINFTVLNESMKKIYGNKCTIRLRETIKNHQHIIRLSEILEDILTVPNFFNIVLGSLQICFLGFTIMMGSWSQIPQSLFLLLSILLQLLMTSYFGENIMTESRRMGDAANQCTWYNMDEKSKKMIHFIILRSQKPQQLTAYNFTKISYTSFSAIISKSWSYFSILRTVYKPTEK